MHLRSAAGYCGALTSHHELGSRQSRGPWLDYFDRGSARTGGAPGLAPLESRTSPRMAGQHARYFDAADGFQSQAGGALW